MAGVYVGVDIGGTNVAFGLIDEAGNLLSRDKKPILKDSPQEVSIGQIIRGIKETASGRKLSGIGIGAPGPLDPFEGVVIAPVNLPNWKNVPLKQIVEEEFGVHVVVDNDANMVAVGERWKGAGREVNDFLCVTLGTGIGGGAICGGKLLHGFNGNATEIGHITLDYNGPRCGCGNYGCFELYASAEGMVRRTLEKMRKGRPQTSLNREKRITSQVIFEAAKKGDEFARQMFDETGFFLGVGLISAINLLNVKMVAITGGLANTGEMILEPARRTIQERGFPSVKEKLEIILAQLGEDAALFGAVKCAIDGGIFS